MYPASQRSLPPIQPRRLRLFLGLVITALASAVAVAGNADAPGESRFILKELSLPGAAGAVSLDYFAYDQRGQRLWVPASNTGRVVIIDGRTDAVTSIDGFRTLEVDFKGKRPLVGPTSVALGDGTVYVGNRGDSTICAINATTLKIRECVPVAPRDAGMSAAPDSLTYVAATRELWLTRGVPPLDIPSSDTAITVFDVSDASHVRPKDKIVLGASAEGFAADAVRGRFYTNLEEEGTTVAIDVHSHKIVARWRSACDEAHGLALDAVRGILLVACKARVVAMDVAHDGRSLGSLDTGAGLDNIDYLPSKRLLYAAAAEAAALTVARVDESGTLSRMQTVPTVRGARGVVVDPEGHAYLIDPLGGRILKVSFP
jgi:DNA-binding beta-propeller fold protein YncE